MFFLCFVLFITVLSLAAENDSLDFKLRKIYDMTRYETDNRLEIAEIKHLELLEIYKTEKEVGQIYTSLITRFFDRENSKDKTRYYCIKALESDIDVLSEIIMYETLSYLCLCKPDSSVVFEYYSVFDDECIEKRREAVSFMLKAYNLLKEQNLPDHLIELPAISLTGGSFDYLEDGDEDYKAYMDEIKKKAKKRKQEQIEEGERIRYINSMIRNREGIFESLVYFYTLKPYANDEFYRLMLEGLGDEDLANELLTRLEERISEQKERYKRRDEILELLKQQEEENK
jgi:hypothetical protein